MIRKYKTWKRDISWDSETEMNTSFRFYVILRTFLKVGVIHAFTFVSIDWQQFSNGIINDRAKRNISPLSPIALAESGLIPILNLSKQSKFQNGPPTESYNQVKTNFNTEYFSKFLASRSEIYTHVSVLVIGAIYF